MKNTFLFLMLFFATNIYAQKNTGIPNIPPEYLEQMKKYLPPGTNLPGEVTNMINQGQSGNQEGELPSSIVITSYSIHYTKLYDVANRAE